MPEPSAHKPIAIGPAQAARLVGLSRTTLYAIMKAGELPYVKVGSRRLILTTELADWLTRQRDQPATPV